MEQDVEQRYFAVKDAARYLGLSTSALWRLIREGGLPSYRPSRSPRGAVRLKRDDLDAWMTGEPYKPAPRMPRRGSAEPAARTPPEP